MTAVDTNSTSPSFTPFSRLPAELRLKVWSHCLAPATFSIYVYKKQPNSTDDGKIIIAPPQIPLWDISQETRAFARSQGYMLLKSTPPPSHFLTWNTTLQLPKDYAHTTRNLYSPAVDVFDLDRAIQHTVPDLATEMRRILPLLNSHNSNLVRGIHNLSVGFMKFCALVDASPQVWKSMAAFESLEILVVTGERFSDRRVQMQCALLRNAYAEAILKGEQWKMPAWRFVEWESLLEDAVREGRILELEGLDPEDFLWRQ